MISHSTTHAHTLSHSLTALLVSPSHYFSHTCKLIRNVLFEYTNHTEDAGCDFFFLFLHIIQLQNQSELRAPTPEKAAWFLDAAIAARHSSQRPNTTEEEHRNSHMLFTLHIYQYRMEKTGKGGSKYYWLQHGYCLHECFIPAPLFLMLLLTLILNKLLQLLQLL